VAMSKKKTRILLVDDHKIFREGLRSLLEKQPNIQIVGEAENGVEAVRMVEELSPDVVIMDIAMPDMNGIEATRQIMSKKPDKVKVIGLTMHADIRYVTEMLKAGASGFLLKDCASEELVEAINDMKEDRIYLSHYIKGNLMNDYINLLTGEKHPLPSSLTIREREVLQHIADGKTTKEIASQLGLSPKTVETHRQNIMDKLEIYSTAELVKYAIREGLTTV
jgi:two-component system response regulator NreC